MNIDRFNELKSQAESTEAIELARRFVDGLEAELQPSEIEDIKRRNATLGYRNTGACATHDFCDANMVMAAAFEKVMGREFDFENGEDADLWNRAWSLAKREFLTARESAQ